MKPAPPVTTNTELTPGIVSSRDRRLASLNRNTRPFTLSTAVGAASPSAVRRPGALLRGDALARDEHLQSDPHRSGAVRGARSPLRRGGSGDEPPPTHPPGGRLVRP